MTTTDETRGGALAAVPPAATPAGLGRKRSRLRARRVVVALAVGWMILLVVVSLTVQWLPIHDPTTPTGLAPNLGPSLTNGELLGTDAIGRSMLSRLAYGARVSLGVSVMATIVSLLAGVLLGLIAVYFGRFANTVINVLANTVLAVPSLLLLLAIVLAFTPSLFVLTAALGLVHIPHFMRLTYSNARSQMARDYIVSARALGASSWRLIFKEILPNTVLTLISYSVVLLPSKIVAEGSLSFLGFGVPPPTPSWGGMIAQGAPNLTTAPLPALIPCAVLFLTVFSLNTLGDHLRVRLDVRDA